MPFRVKVDGVEIECDTPAEASQLVATMRQPNGVAERGAHAVRSRKAEAEPTPTVNGADYAGFAKELNSEGKALVVAIRNAGEHGIITRDLAQAIGVPAQNIKFIMKKVAAAGVRRGLSPEKIVASERVFVDRKAVSNYRMATDMRAALASVK
jgi:hypothetical protein